MSEEEMELGQRCVHLNLTRLLFFHELLIGCKTKAHRELLKRSLLTLYGECNT